MEIKFIYLIHSVLLNSLQKYQMVLITSCSCLFAFPNFSLLKDPQAISYYHSCEY